MNQQCPTVATKYIVTRVLAVQKASPQLFEERCANESAPRSRPRPSLDDVTNEQVNTQGQHDSDQGRLVRVLVAVTQASTARCQVCIAGPEGGRVEATASHGTQLKTFWVESLGRGRWTTFQKVFQ